MSASESIAGLTLIPGDTLTAYEGLRASKIESNNLLLFNLGLISEFEMKVSNLRARGVKVIENDEEDDSDEDDKSGSEYDDSGDEKEEEEEEENGNEVRIGNCPFLPVPISAKLTTPIPRCRIMPST
jgi:hypothetical protein